MSQYQIHKEDWTSYLDRLSKSIQGQELEIEVAGLEVGDQIQEDWTPLEGLSYDPSDDAVYVQTAALDHSIRKPQEIYAEEADSFIQSVVIRDGEGQVQTVHFRNPLKFDKSENMI